MDEDALYALNDALGQWANANGIGLDPDDESWDSRLDEATHTAARILRGDSP